jgi:HlyD family secretion protein
MRKRTAAVGSILGLSVLIGTGAIAGRMPSSLAADAIHPVQGPLTVVVQATGAVGSDDTIDIKYALLARVTRLLVREGHRVQAGQLLAQMETDTLSAQLAQARAARARTRVQLAEARRLMLDATAPGALLPAPDSEAPERRLTPAQAGVARTRVQLWQARRQWERMADLVQKGFVAQSEADVADSTYRTLMRQLQIDEETARLDADTKTAAYEALHRQLEADEAAVQQAQVLLDQASIRAPRAGVVTALYVEEGEVLGSATAARPSGKPNNVLMTVTGSDRFVVYVYVNALDIALLRTDLPVSMAVDSMPGQKIAGTVIFIGMEPTITDNVTTYRVTVALSERLVGIRLGLPVNASIAADREVGVLAPLSAIGRSPWGPSVLRVAHGRVESVPVELGLRTATAVVVRRGLTVEDTILVDGTADTVSRPVEPRVRTWDLEASPSNDKQTVRVPRPPDKTFLQRLFQP